MCSSFNYDNDDLIRYGSGIACPNCDEEMEVHGTCANCGYSD